MAKQTRGKPKAAQSEPAGRKRLYSLPKYGITVEASSTQEAIERAEKSLNSKPNSDV